MKYKQYLPYLIAIVVFVIASLAYFNPLLSGKEIKQGDITQFKGMSRETQAFRAEKGEEPYWIGNAFSGMPAYQVGTYFPNDFIRYVDKAIRFLPRPADYLFLYFLSFFILLGALKVDWKLAILGSLSFGFSTYLIIIFGAGHNAKAHAIGYMPLVLAGVVYMFRQRYVLGTLITSLGMALEVHANHPQMTYYLGFSMLILGIVELIEAYKTKKLPLFAKQAGMLIISLLLGISVNATRLLATKEYASHSTRGASDLTINADGTPKEKSTGLDKAYITEYSYGIAETFNLLIPRFMGGGTVEQLGENSRFYQTIKANANSRAAREYSKQVLTYWGKQPIVEAPAYIGAVVIFLFFLGIFLVKDKLKYWLTGVTVFSIMMSWGKNFPVLTNLFIDYVPLYNKFRAVSSIQVIAELSIPILGVLALKEFFSKDVVKETKENALKKALYIVGGMALLFLVLGASLFSFEGLRDAQYEQLLPELVDALIADRKSMLFNDSIRTLVMILGVSAALWFYLKNKFKKDWTILVISLVIIADLISVDINYVNKEDFVATRKVHKPFSPTPADQEILRDKSYYRVANFGGNPLNEARTSYFHNSIGGYHAAKMRRYQELFDYQIVNNNFEVLNMLNTKYFIMGEDKVETNNNANGSAWFVSGLKLVDTANEEIKALDSLKTKEKAVINRKEFATFINSLENTTFANDSSATIRIKEYDVNKLVYETTATKEQLAVFSEIYYKEGWNAYVDGKKVPHARVNYVLRALKIPSGMHTITFKFEPNIITKGKTIAGISYVLLLLLPLGIYFLEKRRKNP